MSEEKQKLSVREVMNLHGALRSLDGRQKVEAGQVITEPFTFENGAVRLSIAFNIASLNRVMESAELARVALVRETFGTEAARPDHPKMEEFQRKHQEILSGDGVTLSNLRKIKFEDLNADENRMPPSIIAMLMPILEMPGEKMN